MGDGILESAFICRRSIDRWDGNILQPHKYGQLAAVMDPVADGGADVVFFRGAEKKLSVHF